MSVLPKIPTIGESKGGAAGAQNFLNSMQFFRKIWQNHVLAPRALVPLPTGNTGSAPAY